MQSQIVDFAQNISESPHPKRLNGRSLMLPDIQNTSQQIAGYFYRTHIKKHKIQLSDFNTKTGVTSGAPEFTPGF